jgi:protocatechuate 3,4-dioxygenase beta subunit
VRRKVAVAVAIVVVALIAWLWRSHHGAHGAATSKGSGATAETEHGREHRAPQAPATLSGTVTKKTGGAIAGATVSIARASLGAMLLPSQSPTLVVVASAAGTWTSPVPPGTYIVAATAPGFFPGQSERIVVGAGEQRSGVDLALEAGGTLVHGTVADVGGGPIAGARVTLHDDEDISLGGRPDFVTLSAADGTYQLTVRDGSYGAAATHDDYTKQSHTIEVHGKPITQDFTLVPGAVIRGTVIARDSKQPVAGAWIDVRGVRSQSWGVGEAVSDQDGSFMVRSLHSGAVSLTASGPGYASASPTTVEIGIGEQVDGITVYVDRAYTISGKIVDKRDPKKGMPGILVGGFSIASQQVALAHEPTDKDGHFDIVGVRPASYTLGAFGEGSVPDIGKSVEVVDKDITGIVIELDRGATLTGRVDPPGPADISLTIDGEIGIGNMFQVAKAAVVRAQTDPMGNFTLKNVPSGKLIVVAKTEDGSAGKLPVEIGDTDQSGLVVTLETRGSISGTVMDSNGNPAAGAHIDALVQRDKPSFDMDRFHSVTVAADGTFKVVGLDAGKIEVTASWGDGDRWESYRDKDKRPPPLELAKGEQKTGVKLTLEARDGVIRGDVIGSDRKPAADAWISVHRDRSKDKQPWDGGEIGTPVLTGPDGKFVIEHLRRGTYSLVADGPRGGSRTQKDGVKTGDSVTLELAPLGTLAGQVTNRGAPVTSYDLACRGPVGAIDRRITAADGSYALEHLVPGSYTCTISADAGTAKGQVEVPAGDAKLDMTVVPWASVTGVVVSVLSGAPVPNITVIAGGLDGRGMADVIAGTAPITDASGRFTVGHIAAGSGSVTLMPQVGSFDQLAHREYTAGEGQLVDLGTIKIVPPRSGDAGTFGLVASPNKDGKLAVMSVSPGGPAEQAGITTADIITQLDGHAVSDIGAAAAAQLLSSGRIAAGDQVSVTLERGTVVTLTAAKW